MPPLQPPDDGASFAIPTLAGRMPMSESPIVIDVDDQDLSAATSGRFRVLIVDDDPDDVYVMRSALRLASSQLPGPLDVSVAVNGQDGLHTLEKLKNQGALPDVVLLDLNMPVMDGMTMLTHCRADSHFRHLTIVVVTTASDTHTAVKASALGASATYVKPSSRGEMVAVMESISEKYLLD
ncbi:MAG: response regulator [Rhodobiaceae bacterium]|nr:response regulator [Rhodobiaceae bacterium]